MLSRESSFLFNNVIFLVACFTVLWGTLFPILSEWVQGTKVTVGPPFFNRVMIPVGLLLLILTGVGPLLAWRKTSLGSLKRNFTVPIGVALAAGVVMIMIGVAGAAFNQEREQEMGLGDTMQLGRYQLVGKTFTQDDTANHRSDAAIIDVYENGKSVGTMYPEKRLFKANNEPGTIVSIRSTLRDDLYLVFAGLNDDSTKPI